MASNHFLSGSSRTTLAEGFSSISAASICWKRCEIFRLRLHVLGVLVRLRMWSASFFMRSSKRWKSTPSLPSSSWMMWIMPARLHVLQHSARGVQHRHQRRRRDDPHAPDDRVLDDLGMVSMISANTPPPG